MQRREVEPVPVPRPREEEPAPVRHGLIPAKVMWIAAVLALVAFGVLVLLGGL